MTHGVYVPPALHDMAVSMGIPGTIPLQLSPLPLERMYRRFLIGLDRPEPDEQGVVCTRWWPLGPVYAPTWPFAHGDLRCIERLYAS